MKVAAYQAPYLPFGSRDGTGLINEQLTVCEAQSVEVLCCPEAIIGGLAHESDGQSPADVALGVDDGELADVLGPLMSTTVTVIVGSPNDQAGNLFSSAAVISDGRLASMYRKVFPGYRTVIQAGTQLPVLTLGRAHVGVMICNDIWYVEPARILAAPGAAARSDRAQLVVADVEAQCRPYDPRGWDGRTNPDVTKTFLRLWDSNPD